MELDFSKLIKLGRREFKERVGYAPVFDFPEIPLKPRFGTSCFEPHEVPKMLEFCKKNRAYHIVTCITYNMWVNRPVMGLGAFYGFADGDQDPNLAILQEMTLAEWQLDLGFELWSNEPLSELSQLQGCFDPKNIHKMIDPNFLKKFGPK